MEQTNNDFLVKDTQLIPYEELVNIVNGFRDQLQSLDYRVTNKNFGSKLYQTKETINSKSRFVAGADDEVVIMDAQNPTYRLWAGAKDPAAAPFSVDKFGNLIANSVTLSGYLQVGEALSDIGAGNITSTYIGSNAITTAKLAAEAVTAVKIDVDDLFAQNITATGTITGARLRTASSGARVEMSTSANSFKIYDASALRLEIYENFINFNENDGTQVGSIYAGDTGNLLINVSQTGQNLLLNAPTSGAIVMSVASNIYMQLISGEVRMNTWIDMSSFHIDNCDGIYFDDHNANPDANGHMVYYDVGASEGIRCQFGGSDFQFDATAV